MHSTRNKLLHLLAKSEFISGTDLGAQLGISRSAIGKHIDALKQLGLDVFSVRGKGYKLSEPLSLLSHQAISEYVRKQVSQEHYCQIPQPLQLEVLNVVDSTNTYIKQNIAQLSQGASCIAEAQSAGRGRHGRQWISPFASSIYLSMYWRFSGGYQTLSGLSLVIGLAVNRTLMHFGITTGQLKWPNDIYINMQKIAGILIEVEGSVGDEVHCVIGLGLNVNLPDDVTGIDQPFTDLQTHSQQAVINRNHLTAQLILDIQSALTIFEASGLSSFISEWEALNVFAGKDITLLIGQQTVHGICKGIDAQGALRVMVDGEVKTFHGGEISVRAR
jgi:BirA family biotin operon repressor/biotin-[acetyl-CoA-carboxylase] ligase